MKTVSISLLLDQAVEARIGKDMETCLSLATQLKKQIGLAPGSFSADTLEACHTASGASWNDIANVALLWTSVERWLHGGKDAERLLGEIEKFIWQHDALEVFGLSFERGMLAFEKGAYADALEYFQVGKPLAQRTWEILCTNANILFCLEGLGISYDSAWSDLSDALALAPHSNVATQVTQQLEAFQSRGLFRSGRIKDIFASEADAAATQAKYHRLWVKSLPYHQYFEPVEYDETIPFHASRFFSKRGYRLRSLLGTIHPYDGKGMRLTEVADRLYLWVWRWLASTDNFAIRKVTNLLRSISLSSDVHSMTAEDIYLVRNALLWLGLFYPKQEPLLRRELAVFESHLRVTYPIFEAEAHLIYYCRAIRDGNSAMAADLLAAIDQNPVFQNTELYFGSVVASLRGGEVALPPFLVGLRDRLSHLFASEEKSESKIVVRVQEGVIEVPENEKPIYSLSMAAALNLLRSEARVSLEDFCKHVFGFHQFDPIVHMPRIYNLLSRLKALPNTQLSFRVKNGLVVTEGSWDRIGFSDEISGLGQWSLASSAGDGAFDASVSHDGERERSHKVRTSSPTVSPTVGNSVDGVMVLSWEGYLKRNEVEKILQRPRSTTNRILSKLVKKGLLKRQGGARNTQYSLVQSQPISLEKML